MTEIRERTLATLRELEQQGLLQGERNTWKHIVQGWTFPLWGVDTCEVRVKRSELQEERDRTVGSWE